MRSVPILAAAVAACTTTGPVLTEVRPATAAAGAQVTLRGARLCGDAVEVVDGACTPLPSGAVDLGLRPPIVRAVPISWRDDAIVIEVPAAVAPGATTVYVTVDGRSSNGVTLEIVP
ncbi:MAG: hypothetical protein R3B06_03970 [Kofleriaceae bacterium]